MKLPLPQALRRSGILPGLVAGLVLLALFVALRQPPVRDAAATVATPVNIIVATALKFQLEARGHGIARPAETWRATANVAGRVVERHPDLENGALLPAGTLLLALDPSRYQLAIAEAQGQLASLAAEFTQLEREEDNTLRLLNLEQERLVLSEEELARIERLAASGSVSSSRRDEQRRNTLAQRQAVTVLENTLALLPARREILEAQRDRSQTRLEQARRDLEDTRFVAPYDLRLGDIHVELHQHAAQGQQLFQADSLLAAEVEARIPMSSLRRLLASVIVPDPPDNALDLGERVDLSAISAELALAGAPEVRWSGRVVRVASGLDPATRTVRVVVRVAHPYRDAMPPDRPPLQRAMYTRVRLAAPSPQPRLVVPATAVHQGELYLVDSDNRLRRRTVDIAFEQGDLAVIGEGLAPGERIVVDDLPLAIDGTLLAPQRDEALETRIAAAARGTQS